MLTSLPGAKLGAIQAAMQRRLDTSSSQTTPTTPAHILGPILVIGVGIGQARRTRPPRAAPVSGTKPPLTRARLSAPGGSPQRY